MGNLRKNSASVLGCSFDMLYAYMQHWDESANADFGVLGMKDNDGECQKCSRTPLVHKLDS